MSALRWSNEYPIKARSRLPRGKKATNGKVPEIFKVFVIRVIGTSRGARLRVNID